MGSTMILPGEQTVVVVRSVMHQGMDGPHLFQIDVRTNDPVEPVQTVYFRANFG